MIDKLSNDIAIIFFKNDIMGNEMIPIYKLGIEVIISTFITTMGILVLGTLCRCFFESLVFCLCFTTLRNYTGGYHSKTRVSCNLVTWCYFLLLIIILDSMYSYSSKYVSIVLSIVVKIIFAFFAPVENKNKPLSGNIKTKNRKYMFFVVFIWDIIALILYCCQYDMYMKCIYVTEAIVMGLVLLERRKCLYEKRYL